MDLSFQEVVIEAMIGRMGGGVNGWVGWGVVTESELWETREEAEAMV